MTAIVVGDAVSKLWGATQALAGATFEIGEGITGLLGANGAGKTTMLGLILGMHRPDTGSIKVLGHDPWHLGPRVRARIGYAPEHDALPPDVTAQTSCATWRRSTACPREKRQPGLATRSTRSAWTRSASAASERCRPASGSG